MGSKPADQFSEFGLAEWRVRRCSQIATCQSSGMQAQKRSRSAPCCHQVSGDDELLMLVRYRLRAALDRQLRGDCEFVRRGSNTMIPGRVGLDYENEDNREAERVGHQDEKDERERGAVLSLVRSVVARRQAGPAPQTGRGNARLGAMTLAAPELVDNNSGPADFLRPDETLARARAGWRDSNR
jgi:hypothetical protein